MKPRVSVLIPNYNNGKESSRSGDFDFTTILLKSLRRTLSSETTPFEIIVYDDGSTDDSLATFRDWAKRKWTTGVMKGEPLITLIEAEHDGCLARTSNKLVQASKGDIWVRLDGDIEILTPNWVTELCAVFDNGPKDLGVVGPKQLKTDGRIHSMGDFVLDPRGYVHEGEYYPREAYGRTIEVDHVMGCFYCCKREVYEAVGGFDETFLRGQTVDFGMMSRLQGYRCWATPSIEFHHHLTLRFNRSNTADTSRGIGSAVGRFREKWGFCRLQPDLEAVRERYRGTPLLWNAKYFGPLAKPQRERQVEMDKTEWGLFSTNEVFQAAVDRRITEIAKIWHSSSKARPIVEVGCRAGLMLHLLATQGVPCLGYDEDPALIDLANEVGGRHEYPGPVPIYEHIDDPAHLPLETDSVEILVVTNLLERYWNPTRLLAEVRRCLLPGGVVFLIAQRPVPGLLSYAAQEHRYFEHQIAQQLRMLMHPERSKAIDPDPLKEMFYACNPAPEAPLDTTVRLAKEAEAKERLAAAGAS